jgi:hypothetical protein
VDLADKSAWQFQYDYLGQVTNGVRLWQNGNLMPWRQYAYAFDEIGNRLRAITGGDLRGQNRHTAAYAVNSVNQITERAVPGAAGVTGADIPTARVTVNGTTADRRGTYFWKELSLNNPNAPVWTNLTVKGTATETGSLFVAKSPEQFTYDDDGNLTSDGRFLYTWDAENRLIQVETLAAAYNAGAPRQKLEFKYDWLGRRISKIVYNWDSSSSLWSPVSSLRFLYSGWNLIAVLNSDLGLLTSFVWGTDLSGTFQGAGGVGGLLMANFQVQSASHTCFPAYDGNGNVAALVNADNGTVAAEYEYGPFAELVRATGPLASVNPIRFSTKFTDDETGLMYYPEFHLKNIHYISFLL